MCLDVHRTMKIIDVKNTLLDLEGIPVSSQRLIYRGKDLYDVQSLEDHSIGQDSHLNVSLRVRGGGPFAAAIVAVGGTAMTVVGTVVGGPAVGALMLEKTAEATVIAAAVPSA